MVIILIKEVLDRIMAYHLLLLKRQKAWAPV